MDNNFLSGGIAELQEAKTAISESAHLQSAFDAAMANASAKEKDLESQKKYVNDKANSAIKDRRSQLKKAHDEQVDAANKNLKEAEKKRRVAKSDAVQARITDETSDLVGQADALKKQTKKLFKDNKVPGFCNSKFFYSLYAPKSASDFVILVITVVVTLGLIPNVVCALLQTDKLIIKILIYLAIVVFFVAIYFIVFLISKRNTKGGVLEQGRGLRKELAKKNKEIKKMSKTIVKDKDESSYGLEGYDSEIESLQQTLNDTVQKREEALRVFDEETAVQIREEIQKENQPTIDQMTEELRVSREAFEDAKTKAAQAAENVTSNFEVYLGKKNTSAEKIDGLISLIQEGKAKTIMEALDVQNGEIK